MWCRIAIAKKCDKLCLIQNLTLNCEKQIFQQRTSRPLFRLFRKVNKENNLILLQYKSEKGRKWPQRNGLKEMASKKWVFHIYFGSANSHSFIYISCWSSSQSNFCTQIIQIGVTVITMRLPSYDNRRYVSTFPQADTGLLSFSSFHNPAPNFVSISTIQIEQA